MTSYVSGGGTRPLLGETLGACFDRIAQRFGEREALVVRHQNIRWTYRELQTRVDNLAVSLLRLGLNPGERIVVEGIQKVRGGVKVKPQLVPLEEAPAAAPSASASGG